MPEVSGPLDQEILTTSSPWGIPVRVVDETGSTNDDLLALGEKGAPAGTLLFAERQTAGRGQFRRHWSSARGLGIWCSLLLRMDVSDATIPSLSAFPAVALVETLQLLGIRGHGIKAPNDILIDGRKIAGILVETRTGRDPYAVVGIGLNVNHAPGDFPEELKDRAVSLAMLTGRLFDRTSVAAVLIEELAKAGRLMQEAPGELLAAWDSHLLPAQAANPES